MIPFKAYTESKKSIYLFDMDETLFTYDHDALKIHVLDSAGNKVDSLTNSEFNSHKLPKGHNYDFSDFRSSDVFVKEAKPIRKMLAKMKAISKNGQRVEILTARGDMDDRDKFVKHLAKYGIDAYKIHVRRAGNYGMAPPEAKKHFVDQMIRKEGYNEVHLYDDSASNIRAFMTLKEMHPKVMFFGHLVKSDGKEVSIERHKK